MSQETYPEFPFRTVPRWQDYGYAWGRCIKEIGKSRHARVAVDMSACLLDSEGTLSRCSPQPAHLLNGLRFSPGPNNVVSSLRITSTTCSLSAISNLFRTWWRLTNETIRDEISDPLSPPNEEVKTKKTI